MCQDWPTFSSPPLLHMSTYHQHHKISKTKLYSPSHKDQIFFTNIFCTQSKNRNIKYLLFHISFFCCFPSSMVKTKKEPTVITCCINTKRRVHNQVKEKREPPFGIFVHFQTKRVSRKPSVLVVGTFIDSLLLTPRERIQIKKGKEKIGFLCIYSSYVIVIVIWL